MYRFLLFFSILILFTSTTVFAQFDIFADVALNKDIFYPPDQLQVWVRGSNAALDERVDIYFSVSTPEGKELFAPEFTELSRPWVTDMLLPQGFSIDWSLLHIYELPSTAFPLAIPGSYVASMWLCSAGTDERITLGSSQQFTIAPCERKSWLNENFVYSLKLASEGLWVGLANGVECLSLDGSSRRMWLSEDGPSPTMARIFNGFGDDLILAGNGPGIFVRNDYGWNRLLSDPTTPAYVFGVRMIVTDRDDTIWLVDKWDPSGQVGDVQDLDLTRLWPSGRVDNYSADIEQLHQLCLTADGDACAVAIDGLHIFNGDSFDFYEIPDFATEASLTYISKALGDIHGNVWVAGVIGTMTGIQRKLLKYDLNTNEITRFADVTSEVLDIKSDPQGNIWIATATGLGEYNGDSFLWFPTPLVLSCVEFGMNGEIYCGSYGKGVRVLKDGLWYNYENPDQPLAGDSYQFAMGLEGGSALLAFSFGDDMPGGYEVLEDNGAFPAAEEELPFSIKGLSPGRDGMWAWGWFKEIYHETASGWIDTTEDWSDSSRTLIMALRESDAGVPYALTQKQFFEYHNGVWTEIPTPDPGSWFHDICFGNDSEIYLLDYGVGIAIRGTDGEWTVMDQSNLLPGFPKTMMRLESGALYVSGQDAEGGWFLTSVVNGNTSSRWLGECGYPTKRLSSLTSDLGGRIWMFTQAEDLSGRIVIYNPDADTFSDIPWKSGAIPHPETDNTVPSYFDSLPTMGVYWWTGYKSGVSRVNFAPRTEILLEKEVYSHGDTMRVDAYFANQAGSIPIDWYAAAENENGNLFYWPTYTQAKTPAYEGLLVPTDTALILQLDNITIPDNVPPGHYTWKTGFTRAGQDVWLGLGFTETCEFDITDN